MVLFVLRGAAELTSLTTFVAMVYLWAGYAAGA
jgi:hypothetical protein